MQSTLKFQKLEVPFRMQSNSHCPITANCFSYWTASFFWCCTWILWISSKFHSQTNTHVEQSRDRQVVLNCPCEDHFVIFIILQINCSSVKLINRFFLKGGLTTLLNPPVFFLYISFFLEKLEGAQLNKLLGLGVIWDTAHLWLSSSIYLS